jgi:hypothetical protein
MRQLCAITERSGEAEYEWFTLGLPEETDKELLEQFFGGLDVQENDWGEKYMTSDWSSAVWVNTRREVTEKEINTLSKFSII